MLLALLIARAIRTNSVKNTAIDAQRNEEFRASCKSLVKWLAIFGVVLLLLAGAAYMVYLFSTGEGKHLFSAILQGLLFLAVLKVLNSNKV